MPFEGMGRDVLNKGVDPGKGGRKHVNVCPPVSHYPDVLNCQ